MEQRKDVLDRAQAALPEDLPAGVEQVETGNRELEVAGLHSGLRAAYRCGVFDLVGVLVSQEVVGVRPPDDHGDERARGTDHALIAEDRERTALEARRRSSCLGAGEADEHVLPGRSALLQRTRQAGEAGVAPDDR